MVETMTSDQVKQVRRMQYRRGVYLLNRLEAQSMQNKTVSLTYRGVAYSKEVY